MADLTIPAGGRLIRKPDGGIYLVYTLSTGGSVYYHIPDEATLHSLGIPIQVTDVSEEQFTATLGENAVNAGKVNELFDAKSRFPAGASFSFEDWLNKELEIAASGAGWINDPEVRAIYVDYLLNKERVSADELTFRLEKTEWWNTRTNKQRQWDDLSQAEQDAQVAQWAAKAVEHFFRLVGRPISITHSVIQDWALQLASGTKTEGQLIEEFKQRAIEYSDDSPWAREIRAQEEASRQRDVDIGETTEMIRQIYVDWGLPLSQGTLEKLAKDLVEKRIDENVLMDNVRQQAQALYGHNPSFNANVETRIWAEPYMQKYSLILERGAPGLDHPDVQRALQSGQTLYDFELSLKNKDEWLQTKNAHDELTSAFAQVSKIMGFS